MNGIQMLKRDHREIESMFRRIERGKETNNADKQKLARDLMRELTTHAVAEEEVVYPLVRRRIPKLEATVLKSLEEHHLVKVILADLQHLKPTSERFGAKIRVLMDLVRKHVAEEEEVVLPALERVLSAARRLALGSAIERAKKVAPTRPHPLAPDTPPANVVAGVGVALFNRARDAGRELVRRASSRRGNARSERAVSASARRPKRRAGTQRATSSSR